MKQLVLLGLFLGSIAFGANQPAPCDLSDNIVVNGIQYINVACNASCDGSSGSCAGKGRGARCTTGGQQGLCAEDKGVGGDRCKCDPLNAVQPTDPTDPGAGF